MSVGLEQLLSDIDGLPADGLRAEACDAMAAAIARGIDVSPRLAVIVMRHCGTSVDQLRAMVARHERRQHLMAVVRAGDRASHRLDVAQQRADRAIDQVEQMAADVEQLVRDAEQARADLLDPALLSAHQAARLAEVTRRHDAAQSDLAAAIDRQREARRAADLAMADRDRVLAELQEGT